MVRMSYTSIDGIMFNMACVVPILWVEGILTQDVVPIKDCNTVKGNASDSWELMVNVLSEIVGNRDYMVISRCDCAQGAVILSLG